MSADPSRVLVVDDDPGLRGLLERYLAGEGYSVAAVADGAGLRAALSQFRPDVLVLDLMLPGEDGLALLRSLKGGPFADLPILMLSARGEDIDRIIGLEAGADDYLGKPFNPRELIARLRALMRRNVAPAPENSDGTSRFGPFHVNLESRSVWRGEQLVPLTSGEFSLLRVFIENPCRVLSRDQLLDRLKGYARDPFDRSVDVRVTRLRRKLEDDPQSPVFIRTVWGVGYLFAPNGDVPG